MGSEGSRGFDHLHANRFAAGFAGRDCRGAGVDRNSQLGPKYLPAAAIQYKGKKDAQDAHEAIRPTDVNRTPDSIAKYLSDEQLKLYKLIWQRMVASQMTAAIFDVTTVEICSSRRSATYEFRVSGIGAGVRWLFEGL